MIRLLMALISAVIILASCSKDEDDKLEGKWQLQQVETNGQIINVDTVFYNFQTSLFMYQIYNAGTDKAHYDYGYKERNENNQLVLSILSADFMRHTDWDSLTETFSIERLTGNQLILNRKEKRYIFRKY